MSVADNPSSPSGFPFCSNVLEKWNDRSIALLRDLISQKLSALQIANAMSKRTEFTYTRNAIIGKARRLGLALLGNDNAKKPVVQKPPKRKYNPVTALKLRPQIPTEPQGPTLADVVANPKRLSILEMRTGQCYWPTSHAFDQASSDITFCGHATEFGDSWCRAHQSIGYVKPQSRIGWNRHTR